MQTPWLRKGTDIDLADDDKPHPYVIGRWKRARHTTKFLRVDICPLCECRRVYYSNDKQATKASFYIRGENGEPYQAELRCNPTRSGSKK